MTWNNFSDIEELNEELVYLNYGIYYYYYYYEIIHVSLE